ncbi:DsrE family protein [uncultured Ruegeria sp.]|uniref:DsrE family protein n=1 Tax=uncultured Ruegeria sp. TaxID=259304 RepID=UPI002635E8E1|nr:DsrE family protein [uncultured Ruegeria sp.]
MKNENGLIVIATKGIDHELSSVALVIACGALTSGQSVSLFLTSAGVDIARKKGASMTHVKPLDPLAEMLTDFQSRGGQIWACPPCAIARGYDNGDLIDGVEIVGGAKLFNALNDGARTISL